MGYISKTMTRTDIIKFLKWNKNINRNINVMEIRWMSDSAKEIWMCDNYEPFSHVRFNTFAGKSVTTESVKKSNVERQRLADYLVSISKTHNIVCVNPTTKWKYAEIGTPFTIQVVPKSLDNRKKGVEIDLDIIWGIVGVANWEPFYYGVEAEYKEDSIKSMIHKYEMHEDELVWCA